MNYYTFLFLAVYIYFVVGRGYYGGVGKSLARISLTLYVLRGSGQYSSLSPY